MSSSSQDQARILAERIARRISHTNTDEATNSSRASARSTADTGNVGEELAAVRAGLDELQHRLAHLESHLTRGAEDVVGTPVNPERASSRREQQQQPPEAGQRSSPFTAPPTSVRSPWLSGMYVPATTTGHPSQERFGVEEAAVSELVDYFEREKTCNLEPGGKPCDHCSMCSSRGF